MREGSRPERVTAARAEVENARAALAAAVQTAADLVLLAPVSGTVMVRNAEPGEVVECPGNEPCWLSTKSTQSWPG